MQATDDQLQEAAVQSGILNVDDDFLIPEFSVACVAGARKGKGERKSKSGARARRDAGAGRGWWCRKRLQLSHCLFRLSRSPTNEKSPLVRFKLCVNHCLIRPSDWSRCFGSHLRMKIKLADALERDREAKFEQILKEILLELEDKGRKTTLKDEQRKAVKQLYGKKTLWQFYRFRKESHPPVAGVIRK